MDDRRKRLLYIATHRGTKEADLFVGAFAKARLADMSEAEVTAFDTLLHLPDNDLMNWVTGSAPVPAEHDTAVLRDLIAFNYPADK